jgi:hypothetical protein
MRRFVSLPDAGFPVCAAERAGEGVDGVAWWWRWQNAWQTTLPLRPCPYEAAAECDAVECECVSHSRTSVCKAAAFRGGLWSNRGRFLPMPACAAFWWAGESRDER